jgi:hypothetical protein
MSHGGGCGHGRTNLDSHGSHDCALVALQRFQRNLPDLRLVLAKEELTRVQEHLLVLALNLNLKRNIQCKKNDPKRPKGTEKCEIV